MWEFMVARPHVFVDSYAQGIQRVRESKGTSYFYFLVLLFVFFLSAPTSLLIHLARLLLSFGYHFIDFFHFLVNLVSNLDTKNWFLARALNISSSFINILTYFFIFEGKYAFLMESTQNDYTNERQVMKTKLKTISLVLFTL